MEVNESRLLGRVTHVAQSQQTAYIELRNNGAIISYEMSSADELSPRDVVLVGPQWDDVERHPDELWPEDPWIGIVRVILEDEVVISIGDRPRTFALPDGLNLTVGNTVEGTDSAGVTRILAEKPIPQIEISLGEPVDVGLFKSAPSGRPSFDDFGGSPEIIERARELIEVPLEHHEALLKIGARPVNGVLFTGESGTGKTLLARIIANNAKAEFYQIKGPEIVSKWLGQSEEIVRKVFEDAEKQERAIIFFDEIDSLAPQRGDDTHEATRRLVGQLLTLMDGFDKRNNVVVIGTTNRPQDLDSALRRPGRFDWQIEFPLPSEADREAILQVSASQLRVEGTLPFSELADRSEGWSAADLAAIWTEAALLAVRDGRDAIMAEDCFGGFERVAKHKETVEASRRQVSRLGESL